MISLQKKLEELQVPTSRPIDFGNFNEENQVRMLLSWIKGNNLEVEISHLSKE